MTIQDALERAKQLRRTRDVGQPTTLVGRPQRPPDDDTPSPAIRHERPLVEAAPASSPGLDRVVFDHEECRKRRVLVTEQQLREMGSAAAAVRQLRSRVLHRMRSGGWSCIGITSSGAGEGKTLTTVNLAISIAREQQRDVYLLDLDMRNPSVFESLGVRPPRSLSQFFSESLAPEQVLFATEFERLMLAGNRDAVPNASELLASPKLDELLAYIRRRAPGAVIVIDLPPAVSTDEALVVAPRTDALFLVVCEGKTRRDGLTRAINVLSDFPVAGIIMNRASEQLGQDYYAY